MSEFLEDLYGQIIEDLEIVMDSDFPNTTMENDGIGAYEFWGAKCFDHGTDSLVIDDLDKDIVVPVKWSKRLIEAVVHDFNDCENYVSYVSEYQGNEYEDTLVTANYEVVNVVAVKNGIKFITEWKELEY